MAVETIIDPGILGAVLKAFNQVISGGFGNLMPGAMRLLRSLAVMEMVISTGMMIGARSEILQHLLWKAARLGFFVILVTHLESISNAFMNALVTGGLLVGGNHITVSQFLDPGTVFLLGLQTTSPILTYIENLKGTWSSIVHMPVIIAYVVMAFVTWISFLLIACHIAIAVIEFKLLTVMALMLIPWGIFGHTVFLAEGVIGGIVGGAVRLGVLAAVTSIIVPILKSPLLNVGLPNGEVTYQSGLSLMSAAVILCIISWTAPNFAASLLGTGPALTGQSLVRVATTGVTMASAGVSRTVHSFRKAA